VAEVGAESVGEAVGEVSDPACSDLPGGALGSGADTGADVGVVAEVGAESAVAEAAVGVCQTGGVCEDLDSNDGGAQMTTTHVEGEVAGSLSVPAVSCHQLATGALPSAVVDGAGSAANLDSHDAGWDAVDIGGTVASASPEAGAAGAAPSTEGRDCSPTHGSRAVVVSEPLGSVSARVGLFESAGKSSPVPAPSVKALRPGGGASAMRTTTTVVRSVGAPPSVVVGRRAMEGGPPAPDSAPVPALVRTDGSAAYFAPEDLKV
jgi:hypothetical protein